MQKMIQDAVEVFAVRNMGNDDNIAWASDNIRVVMEHLCSLPVGEQVDFPGFITSIAGDEKAVVAVSTMMPYLAGPYGPLDLTFETKSGQPVDVRVSGRDSFADANSITCIGPDGSTLSHSDVLVIFRRNNRNY